MIRLPRQSLSRQTLRRHAAILLTASSLALGACSRDAEAPAVNAGVESAAVANEAQAAAPIGFTGGDGTALGTVTVGGDGAGSMLAIATTGMPAGVHGIHLHEKGQCDGPKFESAGAHLNPGKKMHGRDNPQGAHLGDLANLTVGADGTASTSTVVAGANGDAIGDADGTALVIHAKADDYKTDPSGASGDRIACAVLAAPK